MIVQPKVRGFICTTAHPVGCAANVQEQIDYIQKQGLIPNGPKRVLVIGASTGYGLASRIVAAFGCKAATIGVSFEKEAEGEKKTATAGWYNSVAVEDKAIKAGLYAKSFNGDAFSDEIKQQVVEAIKKDLGKIDLVVYSLASPRRQHPKTGQVYKSTLKPIGASYTNKSIDLSTKKLEVVSLPAATAEEIEHTVAVMGGEDWQMWIDALQSQNLLEKGVKTVAYSYVGPELTWSVYRHGTIGKAKEHLEQTARELDAKLKALHGKAVISVNKALVTQSSSAIPFIPLYYVLLSKVMRERKVDENCIEQMYRLFKDFLYSENTVIKTDKDGLIRLDDRELSPTVQKIVKDRWEQLTEENFHLYSDLEAYQKEFLRLFGFSFSNVDYNADVKIDLTLPSQM